MDDAIVVAVEFICYRAYSVGFPFCTADRCIDEESEWSK